MMWLGTSFLKNGKFPAPSCWRYKWGAACPAHRASHLQISPDLFIPTVKVGSTRTACHRQSKTPSQLVDLSQLFQFAPSVASLVSRQLTSVRPELVPKATSNLWCRVWLVSLFEDGQHRRRALLAVQTPPGAAHFMSPILIYGP